MQPTDRPTGSRAGKPRNYSGLLSGIKIIAAAKRACYLEDGA